MKDHSIEKQQLVQAYHAVRQKTLKLCEALAIEDYVIQSSIDVSPPKWHLAHTTWFFETFVLVDHLVNYQPFHPLFHYLFNSYYHGIGKFHPRSQRGFLARPTVENVFSYRQYVDEILIRAIENSSAEKFQILQPIITLGIHHEQQHQELLLMDIKYNFFHDPSFPIYQSHSHINSASALNEIKFISISGGIVEIGSHGQDFCFDNELPRHQTILKSYQLANRLVTNGEYAEFITAGGYQKPELWLSDGWDCVAKNHWVAPLYWKEIDKEWYLFTLGGIKKMTLEEPVAHVSYFEADAYARWRGLRLPLEAEWEHFVTQSKITPHDGNFMENEIYHPIHSAQTNGKNHHHFLGDLWEWTANSYSPYPGFKQLAGALGEYNGKFMSNQMVLRGGSCITPRSHIRGTYRNFFQPEKRWQFSGIRLASDI